MEGSDLFCAGCRRPLSAADRAASISGSVMGDEYTDVYYRCPACRGYSRVCWHDVFCGEERRLLGEPLSEAAGEERVALIRACASPWDKGCRCPAHRAYFGDALD